MPIVRWSQSQYVLCSRQDAGTIQVGEVVTAIASAMTSAVVSKISSWWSGRSDTTTQTTQRQPQRVENTLGLSMRWMGGHTNVWVVLSVLILFAVCSQELLHLWVWWALIITAHIWDKVWQWLSNCTLCACMAQVYLYWYRLSPWGVIVKH